MKALIYQAEVRRPHRIWERWSHVPAEQRLSSVSGLTLSYVVTAHERTPKE